MQQCKVCKATISDSDTFYFDGCCSEDCLDRLKLITEKETETTDKSVK